MNHLYTFPVAGLAARQPVATEGQTTIDAGIVQPGWIEMLKSQMKIPVNNGGAQGREIFSRSVFPIAALRPGLCALALVILTAPGCGPDPRVAKLQAQVDELTHQLEDFKGAVQALQDSENRTFTMTTNIWDTINLHQAALASLQTEIDLHGMVISNLEADAQSNLRIAPATGRAPAYRAPVYQPAGPSHGEMPADVAAQIRAAAEAKWPNDFEMQAYEIKEQTEAWHKLNP